MTGDPDPTASDETCPYCGARGDDVCDTPPPAECERAIDRSAGTPNRDGVLGMAWWNNLSEVDRAMWCRRAKTAVPAEAWAAFKQSGHEP